jgi:hypothetical protein
MILVGSLYIPSSLLFSPTPRRRIRVMEQPTQALMRSLIYSQGGLKIACSRCFPLGERGMVVTKSMNPSQKQARRALSLAGLGVDRVNPRAGRGKFIVVMCPCVVVMFIY